MSESIQVHYCLYLHVHTLLFHSPTTVQQYIFMGHILCNFVICACCHCCASDPVLPFKEDFMAIFCCTVSLFSSLSASPLSLLLCGMFLLFSLMHIETAYWIVSFSAFLVAFRAIFKFYQRRHFAFNHYTHQL